MKRADEVAMKLGNDLSLPGISAADAATAMTELGKAGMTVEQSMAAAKGTLQLATAANISAAAAAEITANSLNMFNLQASESGRVADLLAAAANASSAEITDVAASLQQAGSVFHNANIPIETTVALIAEMANAGIKGSDAGTSLKTMLQRLQSPTNEAAAALNDLKVNIYDLQTGAMLPMRDIIAQFERGLKGLSQQQKDQALNTIFGADAVRGATIIFAQGAEGLDKMSEAVQRHNAAAELAAARSKGLGGAWENLKSQAETLGLTIFNSIAPALTSTVTFFANFVGIIGQAPGTFALMITSLGLLAFALNAVSVAAAIQSLTNYGAALSGLIFTAQNVIRAMFGLQTAFITTAETALAATGGWAALIAIVGLVAYAIYEYNKAQEKTAEEHIKGITAINDQISAYAQQKTTLDALQNNVGDLTDKQKTLADIYNVLDTASKNRVDAATKEKGVVGALADEVDRLNQAKKVEADARLTELASKAYEAYVKQEAAIKRATDAEIAYNKAKAEGLGDGYDYGVYGKDPSIEQQFQSLRNEAIQSAEASKTATTEFENLKSALTTGSTILGTTADKFVQNKEATRELTQTSEGFRQTLAGVTNGQNLFVQAATQTNNVVQQQTGNIKDLRTELQKLQAATNTTIQQKISDIVIGAGSKADAIKAAQEARKNDQQLIDALKQSKEAKEKIDAVEKTLGLSSGGSGGGVSRIKRDATEAKKAVKDLRTELGDLASVLDAMRKGTMMQESGGRTSIKNPLSGATGAFQVMEGNIPAWTKTWLGKSMSVESFRKDIQAQIGVFNGQMGEYLQIAMKKAGGDIKTAIRMAAAAWYGRGVKSMGLYDDTKPQMYKGKEYPSFRSYTTSVLQRTMAATGGGKSLELKTFDEEARRLQDIADTRARINQLINTGVDANQSELDGLKEYENNLNQILKTADDLSDLGLGDGVLVFALPDTAEGAKKLREQTDLLKNTVLSLQSQTDAANESIFELAAEFDDGMTSVQKFDRQIQLLRESGKLTDDQLSLLGDKIHKTREALERAAKAEWAKKLRQEAKSAVEAIENMADGFKTQLLGLQNEKSPLDDFLRSVEGIKQLNLGVGSLDTFKSLFTIGNEIDVEKFGKYIRYWLVLHSIFGDFDASKIDEVINKLKDAVTGFNAVSDATREASFKEFKDNLEGQLDELQRGGREMSVYEKTVKELAGKYKDLTQAEKDNLLAKASQIDAVKQAQESYSQLRDIVGESLTALVDNGWKGFFDTIKNRFKQFLLEMISEWLTSKIFKVLTGQDFGGGSSGGGFGDIFKTIKNIFTGGGSGGGNRITATPNFNPNSAIHYGAGESIMTSVSGASGGIRNWSSLPPPPASLNPANFTGNSAPNVGGSSGGIGLGGGIAIASMAATLIGGLIGGRVGGVISSIGSGAGMGAAIGSIVPGIGTAVGAVVGGAFGLIQSIFGGDPKRKIDKKENMPKLQQGFADAFKQLQELANDKNALFSDPDGTLAKAMELRASIASGFGIKFESKKYRGVAQTQIAQKLAEADEIIKGIREMSDTARTALNIDSRLETSFASGVYMDSGFRKQFGDFKRRNGMLPGKFTGKDYLPSLLADGELVLNERQRLDVINIVGFDPFRHARIPNYASGTFVTSAPSVPTPSAPRQATSAQSSSDTKRPIIVKIYQTNTGIVESDIKEVLIESLGDSDVQVEVVESYDRGKSRKRN